MRIWLGLFIFSLFAALIWGQAAEDQRPLDPQKPTQTTSQKTPEIREIVEVRAEVPVIQGNHLSEDLVSFSRVDRQQLEDLQAWDLLSGLRLVPGVVISRYDVVGSYGGGDGGSLFIRGMGASRPGGEIQFLVDGVPRFSGVWAHPLMDIMGLNQVQRIDVVKGASPVLYGNMGFGAVDMHTRSRTDEGEELGLEVLGGSFNSLSSSFNYGTRRGPWDAYLVAGYQHSDGQRPHSAGELQEYFARVSRRIDPGWQATFTIAHSNNYAQDPGAEGTPVPIWNQFNTDSWTGVATIEKKSDIWDGTARLYCDRGFINWRQGNASATLPEDSNTSYRNEGFRLRLNRAFTERFKFTGGIDWDSAGGRFTKIVGETLSPKDPVYFQNVAPYFLFRAELGGSTKFIPIAGVRWNHSTEFGACWAPELGVAVQRGLMEFHISGSRGFNLPGVYVVYNYQDWRGGDGWQKLHPERVWHTEVGASRMLNEKIRLEVTFFRDQGTDALRFNAPPPHFENIGTYTTLGLESSLSIRLTKAGQFFGGYTWLRATPATLPYAPSHSATIGWNWQPLSRLSLSADAQYIGRRWSGNPRYPGNQTVLKEYALFNSRLTLGLGRGENIKRIRLVAAVENITNSHYEYRPGYPMPGLSVNGGLKFELDRSRH